MTVTRIQDEPKYAKDYALSLFVGEQLGCGAYRRVYSIEYDPTKVLKVEYCGKEFCNVNEWQAWEKVKDTPIEHWFAPCHQIDYMGIALLQSRTTPFKDEQTFNEAVKKIPGGKLPAFFDDVHFANFGMLNGRFVCHDYGFTNFLEDGVEKSWRTEQAKENRRNKMKKVKKT